MRVCGFTTTTTDECVYDRRRRCGGGYTAEGRKCPRCRARACVCVGGGQARRQRGDGLLLIFPFSRVVRLLLLIRRVNFFCRRSIKFFAGGFSPPLVAVVRQPPPHRHHLFRRGRLHCLRQPLDDDDDRYTKIFTEPELMAGKGARTHARTHTRHAHDV